MGPGDKWPIAQEAGDRWPGGQVARWLLDPVLQCGSPVSPPHLLSCLHVCVTLLLPIYYTYIYYKLIFPNISDTITIFWEELSVILYYVTYSTTLLHSSPYFTFVVLFTSNINQSFFSPLFCWWSYFCFFYCGWGLCYMLCRNLETIWSMKYLWGVIRPISN